MQVHFQLDSYYVVKVIYQNPKTTKLGWRHRSSSVWEEGPLSVCDKGWCLECLICRFSSIEQPSVIKFHTQFLRNRLVSVWWLNLVGWGGGANLLEPNFLPCFYNWTVLLLEKQWSFFMSKAMLALQSLYTWPHNLTYDITTYCGAHKNEL